MKWLQRWKKKEKKKLQTVEKKSEEKKKLQKVEKKSVRKPRKKTTEKRPEGLRTASVSLR